MLCLRLSGRLGGAGLSRLNVPSRHNLAFWPKTRHLMQGGPGPNLFALDRPEQWPAAEGVPLKKHAANAGIPDGDGELAFQPFQTISAELAIRGQDQLGICGLLSAGDRTQPG